MRDLCALPRNDPLREARNGKVLGGRRLSIGIEDLEITRWESAVFLGKRKRVRFGGKDGHGGESPGCRYRGLLCDRAER